MNSNTNAKPIVFLIDVDGVMTNGQLIYTANGKTMKVFGPDDHDGLSLLKKFLEIRFVTGDTIGLDISKKRIVDDMKFPLDVVSTIKRIEWISNNYELEKVIFMGDGIFDHIVMKAVFFSIAPKNAHELAKKHANFVTERSGGDRAVAEACIHIIKKFF